MFFVEMTMENGFNLYNHIQHLVTDYDWYLHLFTFNFRQTGNLSYRLSFSKIVLTRSMIVSSHHFPIILLPLPFML